MADPIVIFGNGRMAELASLRFGRDPRFEIVGYTVDRTHLNEPRFRGLPIVPFDEVDRHFPAQSVRMFVAVGPVQANRIRAERFLQARALGYRFASHVSPRASVDPDVRIGENCSIGENAIVGAFTSIGENVFVSAASVVGHHCVLGDHCFVAAGAVVAGTVRVGARAFIGVNATIRDRVAIGEACIIGAGATIVRDTAPGSVHVAPEAVSVPISSDRARL